MRKIFVFYIFLFLLLNLNVSTIAKEKSLNEIVQKSSIYQKYSVGGLSASEAEFNCLKNDKILKETDFLAMIHIYYSKAQHNKVISIAKEGLENFPESSAMYTVLGMSYSSIKNYDEAIRAYSKSINLKPTEPAYFNRGQIYYYVKKDYNKAINDFTKALEYFHQYPDDNTKNKAIADIYLMRAYCYDIKSDYNSAVYDFTKAIKYDQSNPDLYYNRARVILSKVNNKNSKETNSKLILSANEDLDIAMREYKRRNNMNMYRKIAEYKKLQAVKNTVH